MPGSSGCQRGTTSPGHCCRGVHGPFWQFCLKYKGLKMRQKILWSVVENSLEISVAWSHSREIRWLDAWWCWLPFAHGEFQARCEELQQTSKTTEEAVYIGPGYGRSSSSEYSAGSHTIGVRPCHFLQVSLHGLVHDFMGHSACCLETAMLMSIGRHPVNAKCLWWAPKESHSPLIGYRSDSGVACHFHRSLWAVGKSVLSHIRMC